MIASNKPGRLAKEEGICTICGNYGAGCKK